MRSGLPDPYSLLLASYFLFPISSRPAQRLAALGLDRQQPLIQPALKISVTTGAVFACSPAVLTGRKNFRLIRATRRRVAAQLYFDRAVTRRTARRLRLLKGRPNSLHLSTRVPLFAHGAA